MADPADPLSADADSQTTGLILNVAIGVPVTLICVLLFEPLRRSLPAIFETRRRLNLQADPLDYAGNRVATPPAPSYKLFGWLLPTLRLDLETIADTHGLDTALCLRYHFFMIALFSFLCIPAAILLPLYFTAGNQNLPDSNPARTIGINRFSLSNIPRDTEWRFWLVLVVEYVIAVFICVYLIFHFSLYCRDRRRYRAAANPANYAILVQDIPWKHCSDQAVRDYWARVFPHDIAAAYLVRDARALERVKDKFWRTVAKRELAAWRLHKAKLKAGDFSDDPQPQLKRLSSSASSAARERAPADGPPPEKRARSRAARLVEKREEDVKRWTSRQERWWAKVAAQQQRLEEIGIPPTQAAIVVFKSRHAASIAAQTNFARRENQWRTSRAPEPEALNWATLAVTGYTIYVRQAVTALLCVGLTLFWIIPVTLIMGLVNLTSLANIEINGDKPFKFLEKIRDLSPLMTGLFEAWVPTVVLTVFLSFVPTLLDLFVSISRIPSFPRRDALARNWYFTFLVFSNFLFVAFAGTLLNELGVIIDRPGATVEILARNIPKQAAFMMNFIVLTTLTEAPLELLQMMRLFTRWFKMAFRARTKRQRDEAMVGDPEVDFVNQYAISQLIALLGLVYSTIQPFIIPCCLAYFCISYVVLKYNACYSMHNEYQDGGRMYGGALYAIWIGLFSHLLTMVGVFGLNKSAAQSALIIIPTVLSVIFLLYCRKSYDRVIEHGSALETQDRVEQLEGRGGADIIDDSLAERYIHPGLEPLPDEIEDLTGIDDDETDDLDKLESSHEEAGPKQSGDLLDSGDYSLSLGVSTLKGKVCSADSASDAPSARSSSVAKRGAPDAAFEAAASEPDGGAEDGAGPGVWGGS